MKQTLQNLLAEGKTKQVIAELMQLHTIDTDLKAEIVQLSARYAEYERQKRMDLEAPSVLGIELNKINHALLSVIGQSGNSSTPSVSSHYFTTKRLIWFGGGVVALIGLLANLATVLDYLGVKSKDEGMIKNVSVSVENKERDLIPVLSKAAYIIMMVDGGDVKKELIDDKGKASFQNVKVGDKVRLKVDFSEPYRPLNADSLYTIPSDGRLTLTVGLQNLGQVFGRVLWRDQPLEGVLVAVGDLRDTTNDLGRYSIQIPETEQRKEQEVIFKKMSYKTLIKTAHPQTNEPLNIVMEK